MRYVTRDEMKQIDRDAIEQGVPGATLMENAGKAVAAEAMTLAQEGKIVVLCGYGNNGGDGLVAARHLAQKGREVTVFLVGKPKSLSPETNDNLERLFDIGLRPEIISSRDDIARIFGKCPKPGLIIDAIFGIGLRGEIDDFYSVLIGQINSIGAPVLSVDIPSGLDADTGSAIIKAVKAAVTVTLGYPKAGFKNEKAKEYIGRLIVADIGLVSPENFSNQVREVSLPESNLVRKINKVICTRHGRQGRLKPRHPWIYKGQLRKIAAAIKPGDVIKIVDAAGKFIGRGYYNPKSMIAARILTFEDEEINTDFFIKKIALAAEKRKELLEQTNAYRAIYSEADGLPGLIADVYADTVVFQILTLGMEKFRSIIIEGIRDCLRPRYVYDKSVSSFRKLEGLKDSSGWLYESGSGIVEIFEGEVRFLVDIERGHKTGFYLDQRRSRMALGGFSKNKKVLDLFCYTGAFSVSAAIDGAKYVRGVDIKEEWLGFARKNAELNGVSERCEFVKEDAFEALEKVCGGSEKFDMIIIDPPSFLKNKESLASASKGYKKLNTLAMRALTDGGILATFSCSHNMPNEAFSNILKDASQDAGKKFTILKRCHQAEDHPVVRAIPETEYLKGYFLRVDNRVSQQV
ncbi:MAG: NAD(P)H-hydrate epimerase [Candidatus Omnitrophota bacterium]|nr:NAD(P)H-hydrate epimerase [Candidatus Omnitrophota bacterium]